MEEAEVQTDMEWMRSHDAQCATDILETRVRYAVVFKNFKLRNERLCKNK